MRKNDRKIRAPRNQRGLSLIELLLITVPLSILSMVLASAVAGTATAKNKAMWKAALKAEQATKDRRCGAPILLKPALTSAYKDYINGYGDAAEIATIGMPITQTGNRTVSHTEPVSAFTFEALADQFFPDRSREASNTATFPCNEPGDHGDSDRNKYKAVLIGIATEKAREMY